MYTRIPKSQRKLNEHFISEGLKQLGRESVRFIQKEAAQICPLTLEENLEEKKKKSESVYKVITLKDATEL